MEGLELRKVNKIQEVIREKMNGQETFYFSFEEFLKEPLLENRDGLEKILDLIQNGSSKKISWKTKNKWVAESRAGDTSVYPKAYEIPVGIEIHVSDPDQLQDYFKDILLDLEKRASKLNFRFTRKTGIMTIENQDGKKYEVKVQGQTQKEVIGVIFKNPESIYDEWSLYDISEILGSQDVDEVAVKNAIYQFDKKIKLAVPNLERIFDLNKHSARLSPIFKK